MRRTQSPRVNALVVVIQAYLNHIVASSQNSTFYAEENCFSNSCKAHCRHLKWQYVFKRSKLVAMSAKTMLQVLK